MRYLAASVFLAVAGSASAQWNPASLRGQYSSTTGFEIWRLELKANKTATYSWRPDHPGGQDYSGKWSFEKDLITITLKGKSPRGEKSYRWRFLPVKWGNRLYLVFEDEIRDFAGMALRWQDENKDLRAQEGEFHRAPLIRDAHLKPRRFGKPLVPPSYAAWFTW